MVGVHASIPEERKGEHGKPVKKQKCTAPGDGNDSLEVLVVTVISRGLGICTTTMPLPIVLHMDSRHRMLLGLMKPVELDI